MFPMSVSGSRAASMPQRWPRCSAVWFTCSERFFRCHLPCRR
jgi:hypothetical protein